MFLCLGSRHPSCFVRSGAEGSGGWREAEENCTGWWSWATFINSCLYLPLFGYSLLSLFPSPQLPLCSLPLLYFPSLLSFLSSSFSLPLSHKYDLSSLKSGCQFLSFSFHAFSLRALLSFLLPPSLSSKLTRPEGTGSTVFPSPNPIPPPYDLIQEGAKQEVMRARAIWNSILDFFQSAPKVSVFTSEAVYAPSTSQLRSQRGALTLALGTSSNWVTKTVLHIRWHLPATSSHLALVGDKVLTLPPLFSSAGLPVGSLCLLPSLHQFCAFEKEYLLLTYKYHMKLHFQRL